MHLWPIQRRLQSISHCTGPTGPGSSSWFQSFVSVVPNSNDLWFFSGNLHVGLAQQTADVRDGLDCCSDEPRETEQRADEDEDSDDEQVEVVAVRLLQRHRCHRRFNDALYQHFFHFHVFHLPNSVVLSQPAVSFKHKLTYWISICTSNCARFYFVELLLKQLLSALVSWEPYFYVLLLILIILICFTNKLKDWLTLIDDVQNASSLSSVSLMATETDFELVFLAVDNDSRDLLVEEDQNGGEQCGQDR